MNKRLSGTSIALMLGIALMVVGCSDSTTPPQDNQQPEEYEILLSAEAFCGAHIGIAGKTPLTVHVYRELLDHADADDNFKELIEAGTLPGKLYGLAGVYFTDPSSLPDLSRQFLESAESVPTFFGCILSATPVGTGGIGTRRRGNWPSAWARPTG
jgi:hypothetical protein